MRVVSAILLLAACAARSPSTVSPAPALDCVAGDSMLVRETIYFGRNRSGGGTVSDNEWNSFLSEVVTTRFPMGLTVLDATGQWKGAGGTVEQERSELVTIFHPDTEAARRSVQEIAREYKRRFQQEAVLRERSPTCAKFE